MFYHPTADIAIQGIGHPCALDCKIDGLPSGFKIGSKVESFKRICIRS
jgi:hypothetical protein